jgi:Helix-turn-helix domain
MQKISERERNRRAEQRRQATFDVKAVEPTDTPTNRHERRIAAKLAQQGASDDEICRRIKNCRDARQTYAGGRTALENIGARHLSVREAARYTGLSVAFLNRLRSTGGGSRFFKIGARVVYSIADLDDWLERHRRTSTSDKGAA